MLDTADKTAIIGKFQRDANDTGSSEVQIAMLTRRIADLTEHLKVYPNDKHSRRGLYRLVNQRRKLSNYLKRTRPEAYEALRAELGLRS